jgi:hypothetical protein
MSKRVGIVGSEGKKFTPETERRARGLIRFLLAGADEAISGDCHLGGIDFWAKEEAQALGVPFVSFPPKTLSWEAGYKPRNIQIADRGTEVHCITVKELPPGYDGMRFPLCYHCGTKEHIKSGGCWTVKYAQRLGKPGKIHVIGESHP